MRQIEVLTRQAAELREYVRRREADEKRLAYEQGEFAWTTEVDGVQAYG